MFVFLYYSSKSFTFVVSFIIFLFIHKKTLNFYYPVDYSSLLYCSYVHHCLNTVKSVSVFVCSFVALVNICMFICDTRMLYVRCPLHQSHQDKFCYIKCIEMEYLKGPCSRGLEKEAMQLSVSPSPEVLVIPWLSHM